MRKTIEEYEIGDQVDVFPTDRDPFDEFTGLIIKINTANDTVIVVDDYQENWTVSVRQINMAYNHNDEEEDTLNY